MDQYGFKLISYLTAKCQIRWAIGVFKLIIDGQWITKGDILAATASLRFVRNLRIRRCRYVRTFGTLPVNYTILGGGGFDDERRTRHST